MFFQFYHELHFTTNVDHSLRTIHPVTLEIQIQTCLARATSFQSIISVDASHTEHRYGQLQMVNLILINSVGAQCNSHFAS